MIAIATVAALAACPTNRPSATIPAPARPAGTPGAPVATPPAKPAPIAKASARRVRSVEGITEYALDNGLRVLLFPDPTQSTVTVNVTYLVGSRVEGYGETGMAHLLEHLLFKRTPRHQDISKLLDERGADSNGSTWTDRTNYYETLPATPDNLEFALDMEADRMTNAIISPDDLATELSVVRNELEMGENDPLEVLEARIISTAYLWHNYGKDTIGSRADIERVSVPALRAFYEKYYQPDTAVLIVAGKFDDTAALASIEKYFGVIPKPARTLQPTYTIEPVQDGERSVTLRRNGEVHAVGIAYHTVGAASPDFPAVQAALDLLDREPSGRLYKKLVETQLASSISASQTMFRDPYLAMLVAEVRDANNLDKVENIVVDEIEKLGLSKIDPKELERWRAGTVKELELAFADSQQIAIELSEFAALGDWRAIFAYRDRIEKITAADVARVAKAYFKASNRTSGRFYPTKDADRAPLTETPDIAAAVTTINDRPLKYPGEAFVATLETIEARTRRQKLEGGIRAALLAKKTRGAKVSLQLAMHFGDEKSLRDRQAIAALTAELLQRGTTNKSYQDLRDLENQLKSQISVSGHAAGLTLEIDTFRDQLSGSIDLAAEMLQSPSFPAKELALIKQEHLAALEQSLQDPDTLAWNVYARITNPWPKGDPRSTTSIEEQIAAIQKVTVADIKAFHRDFVGASHAELAVVGDFDAVAVTSQITKRFGAWPSNKPYARLVDKPFGVPGASKTITVADKEMSQIVLGHDLALKDSDPDYAAWLLVGQILGGHSGSRIWIRLREKGGMSYGAGAWTSAAALDDSGSIGGYASVAPQNVARAKAALVEEITRLTTTRVSEADLQGAKDSWLKSQDTSLSDDDHVTSMLASQTFLGRTTATARELRAKLRAVTVADIERVANKYLVPSKLVIVDAGDTSK